MMVKNYDIDFRPIVPEKLTNTGTFLIPLL